MITLINKIKRTLKCKIHGHLFYIEEIGSRDDAGKIHWQCYHCNKPFVFDYGLQAIRHGKIINKLDCLLITKGKL